MDRWKEGRGGKMSKLLLIISFHFYTLQFANCCILFSFKYWFTHELRNCDFNEPNNVIMTSSHIEFSIEIAWRNENAKLKDSRIGKIDVYCGIDRHECFTFIEIVSSGRVTRYSRYSYSRSLSQAPKVINSQFVNSIFFFLLFTAHFRLIQAFSVQIQNVDISNLTWNRFSFYLCSWEYLWLSAAINYLAKF